MSIPAQLPFEPQNLLTYGQEWEDHVLQTIDRWPNYRATFNGMRSNEQVRNILHKSASTERHAPDIVARSANGPVIWVECVRSYPNETGNHAIQTSKISAQTLWASAHPNDIFVIAFTSHIGGVIAWASIATVKRTGVSRPYMGRGSGTPFVVVPATNTCIGNYPQALLDAACRN